MRKTLPLAGASVMALGCGDGPAQAAEVQPTQSAPGQPASSLQDRTSLQFAGGMQEYTLTLDNAAKWHGSADLASVTGDVPAAATMDYYATAPGKMIDVAPLSPELGLDEAGQNLTIAYVRSRTRASLRLA